MDEQTSVRLIEALARVWTRIRLLHPEVPAVVLLTAPAARDQMNVLGHFAALRWTGKRKENHHLHEVVVVAEHLDRPAEEIIETLIHEAAHALNFERGIYDCSRSQYHNQRFKAAAEELGLEVAQVRHYGFAHTSLPKTTAEKYTAELHQLIAVLIHRRRPPPIGEGTMPPSGGTDEDDDQPRSRSRKATCACGYIIRVAKQTLQDTTIRCESCGEPFRFV